MKFKDSRLSSGTARTSNGRGGDGELDRRVDLLTTTVDDDRPATTSSSSRRLSTRRFQLHRHSERCCSCVNLSFSSYDELRRVRRISHQHSAVDCCDVC